MVARRGNAPRYAGCEPAALLLSYQAMRKKVPAPGYAPRLRLRPHAVSAPRLGEALPRVHLPMENAWRESANANGSRSAYCMKAGALTGRAAIAPCGLKDLAERQGIEPRTPQRVRLFSRQRPRPTGRAPFYEMAPPLGIAPSSHRLTGGPHTLCVERNCSRQMQSWPRQRN